MLISLFFASGSKLRVFRDYLIIVGKLVEEVVH